MQWEQLTSGDFRKAARDTGVCVIAMGVLEKHGEHLPLGTDFLSAHRISCLAAEREPAVVFPPFYFGQIYEARCFPGTVTIRPTLLIDLLQSVFDEIGRNGFPKILVHNGHGGNTHLLALLAQCALWEPKPYSLYVVSYDRMTDEQRREWAATLKTKYHGHACECETSLLLATHPELVRLDRVPRGSGAPRGRTAHLPGVFTGIGWYADHPEHYAGDARPASAAKGRKLLDIRVASVADAIRAVKKDRTVPALEREFFGRCASPAKRRPEPGISR